jgi:hypothetical protein
MKDDSGPYDSIMRLAQPDPVPHSVASPAARPQPQLLEDVSDDHVGNGYHGNLYGSRNRSVLFCRAMGFCRCVEHEDGTSNFDGSIGSAYSS